MLFPCKLVSWAVQSLQGCGACLVQPKESVCTCQSVVSSLGWSCYRGKSQSEWPLCLRFLVAHSLWRGQISNSTRFPVLDSHLRLKKTTRRGPSEMLFQRRGCCLLLSCTKERNTEQTYLVNSAEKTKHLLGKSALPRFSRSQKEVTLEPGASGNGMPTPSFFLEGTRWELTSDANPLTFQGPGNSGLLRSALPVACCLVFVFN